MIKTILLFLVVFILTSTMKITFNPFKIQFQSLMLGVGCVIVMVGISLIINHSINSGFKIGKIQGVEYGSTLMKHHCEKNYEMKKRNNQGGE